MNSSEKIKVGFCVSYDWDFLKISLPLVYEHADKICLSIDKNRKSWSGLSYEIDEKGFRSFIDALDHHHKIDIYEDDFSLRYLSPLENDNRQRNMMADHLGSGGWHIQIDCDEYFIDFKEFCEFLQSRKIASKDINYSAIFYPIVKRLKSGYLVVKFDNKPETVPMATNNPSYEGARRNGYFNYITPFRVIHETWSRNETELSRKLKSWGHVNDFNKESYLNLWKSLDENNYKYVSNFHPINKESWPSIEYVPAKNVKSLIEFYKKKPLLLSKQDLFLKNSRILAKIKSLINAY